MSSVPTRDEAATLGTAPDRPAAAPLRRPARDADSAGLIALIGGCWAEYPGCVLDVDGEEPWLRTPATAYAGKGGELWVVELAGELVASVGWAPVGPGVPQETAVELKSLYVANAARRQGLGAELVGMVETAARRRGVRTVRLWSDTRFGDAHRLYRRLGYRWTGGTRDLHDRSNTTEYEFVRRLG